MKEYITEHANVSGITIPYMKTSLLTIDKITLHEFDSLVNPRTHLMKGENSNILNAQFREVYQEFINYLMWKPRNDW